MHVYAERNCKQYVDETESVLRTIRQGLNSAESNDLRKKLEENDSGKIAALYQFQHFYEKGDAAERARVFDKAIMNYQSALEQMETLEELGYRISGQSLRSEPGQGQILLDPRESSVQRKPGL